MRSAAPFFFSDILRKSGSCVDRTPENACQSGSGIPNVCAKCLFNINHVIIITLPVCFCNIFLQIPIKRFVKPLFVTSKHLYNVFYLFFSPQNFSLFDRSKPSVFQNRKRDRFRSLFQKACAQMIFAYSTMVTLTMAVPRSAAVVASVSALRAISPLASLAKSAS